MMFTELSFSERKRASVLFGAAKVFVEEGFSQSTMDRVAQAAGVSKRTVYKHFRSKQELFNIVVDGIWTRITQWSVEWMNPEGEPREELRAFASEMLHQVLHPEVLPVLRMAAAEFMQRPDLGREFYQRTGSFGLEDLSVYLTQAHEKGCLEVPDASLAASQFHALIKDPLMWPQMMGFQTAPTEHETAEVIEQAITLFLSLYGKKSS
jgi:AcrR family transcriptional regulator